MAAAPPASRSALLLDFDNVFSALARIDEAAAWRFATEPDGWLDWFAAGADGADGKGGRRLLLRRCYLNGAGSCPFPSQSQLAAPPGTPRVPFSRFRNGLVDAGFQLVDCPTLTGAGKNAADINMVIDILDLLAHPTRFDEFLILTSDADFTPLLHRIRAHDRRVLVVAQQATARAFRAASDAVLELPEFAAAALGAVVAGEAGAAALPASAASALPPRVEAGAADTPAAQQAALLQAIRAALAKSAQPLHLGQLGQRLHQKCGAWVGSSRYGGAGSLQKLVGGQPGLAVETGPGGGWLFDPARHQRPSCAGPKAQP